MYAILEINPTVMTVLGWIRELAIIGGVISVAWKARGVWDDTAKFLNRVTQHMDVLEAFSHDVVTNHLVHIEKALEKMSNESERFKALEKLAEEASKLKALEKLVAEVSKFRGKESS